MAVLSHTRHPGIVSVFNCFTDVVEEVCGSGGRPGRRALLPRAREGPKGRGRLGDARGVLRERARARARGGRVLVFFVCAIVSVYDCFTDVVEEVCGSGGRPGWRALWPRAREGPEGRGRRGDARGVLRERAHARARGPRVCVFRVCHRQRVRLLHRRGGGGLRLRRAGARAGGSLLRGERLLRGTCLCVCVCLCVCCVCLGGGTLTSGCRGGGGEGGRPLASARCAPGPRAACAGGHMRRFERRAHAALRKAGTCGASKRCDGDALGCVSRGSGGGAGKYRADPRPEPAAAGSGRRRRRRGARCTPSPQVRPQPPPPHQTPARAARRAPQTRRRRCCRGTASPSPRRTAATRCAT